MKIKKNNVFYNGYSQDKIDKLLKLARTYNYSAPQLARIFKCGRTTIIRTLEYNKIILPNFGRFKRKFDLNDFFFVKLNTISAYWLGFIATDGNISGNSNSIRIGLNKKDKIHLENFLKAIGCEKEIYINKKLNSANLEVHSKTMKESLTQLGIPPRKSLIIKDLRVSEKLMPHFIRGVYDGDGSLSGRKKTHIQISIAGNKPFLENIQNYLIKRCNLNKTQIYPLKSKAYKLQYTGTQIFRILDFLYEDSNPETRLERKYNLYLNYKNKFISSCNPQLPSSALQKPEQNNEL